MIQENEYQSTGNQQKVISQRATVNQSTNITMKNA